MANTNFSSTESWLVALPGVLNETNKTMTEEPSSSLHVIDFLERITSPIVCLVGTVLNLLTAGTFLSRPLKRISCCLYLATRSIAVFGFLVSVLIALTPLINTEGVCEMTIFLSYFCPFISVWMVVIISVENFIRISQPARVGKLCTPVVARCVIAVFLVVGLGFYNVPLWTSRVSHGKCAVLTEYYQVVLVLNHIDAALTMFCPLVLMVIVVPLVGLRAISAYERKKRLSGGTDSITRNRQQPLDFKNSPETRVTHLLLAVSVAFLALHTPFHGIRIKVFILALSGTNHVPVSRNEIIIMHVCRLIYNLDTCVSCAVYLVFGDNFRRVFCNKYFSTCRSSPAAVSQDGSSPPATRNETLTEVKVVKNGKAVDESVDDELQSKERLLNGSEA